MHETPETESDGLQPPALRPDAVRIEGTTPTGRRCVLVDNTGDGLPHAELAALLQDLVAAGAFGFRGLSEAGGSRIGLDRHEFGHVQVAGRLYRLLVRRYEARLEPF